MTPDTILVSRGDRIGDVVLTLPVFARLRQAFPRARLVAHVRTLTAPLLAARDDVDAVVPDDRGGRPLPLRQLVRRLRAERCTAAVVVHPSPRALWACALAGIPRRVGRASNLWQFLLTDPQHQHRSANDRHETEYNQDLVAGLAATSTPYLAPRLPLTPAEAAAGRERVAQLCGRECRPVVLHPGCGGSALNLAPAGYADLAAALHARGTPALLSLGPGEEALAAPFAAALAAGLPRLPAGLGLRDLAAVLAAAAAFVGGSTGPLHVAAAVGCPTLALFPAVAAMTPRRWGPYGNRSQVLLPAADGTAAGPDLAFSTARLLAGLDALLAG